MEKELPTACIVKDKIELGRCLEGVMKANKKGMVHIAQQYIPLGHNVLDFILDFFFRKKEEKKKKKKKRRKICESPWRKQVKQSEIDKKKYIQAKAKSIQTKER